MRPLHAVSLLAVIAILFLGLYFVLQSDQTTGTVAPPLADSVAVAPRPAAAEPALSAPDIADDAQRAAQAAQPLADAQPAATSAQVKGGVELSGRVIDQNGRPIAAATVYAAPDHRMQELPLDQLDPKTAPWAQRVEAQTDADGRFRIKPMAKATVRCAVRAQNFAPRDLQLAVAGSTHDAGDIALEESVYLSGSVVDAGGRAVADAELRRIEDNESGMLFLGGARGTLLATTDAQGRFEVAQLASGPWKLLIASPDNPDKTESGETERPGQRVPNLRFVVEEGQEISGQVVGVPPALLANLWVRATPRPAGEKADAGMQGMLDVRGAGTLGNSRSARCQSDGSFVLRGLKRDVTYRLRGREGEREYFGRTRTATVMANPGERNVVLAYKPETALVFQVVDAQTSEPVTQLSVQAGYNWLMPLLDEESRALREFPEGKVRFGNLPPRPQNELARVRVEAVGYAPLELTGLTTIEGQDLDLGVVRLERTPLVRVLVLDATLGTPLAGAQVRLVEEQEAQPTSRMTISIDEDIGMLNGRGNAHQAKTGDDGRAAVSSMPGKRARIEVTHAERAPSESEVLELPLAEDVERTLRLASGGTVIVEVADSRGAPVSGVRVAHRYADTAPEPWFAGHDAQTDTDAAGRMSFAHLQPGVHRFRIDEGNDGNFSFGNGAMVRTVRRGSAGGGPGNSGAREQGWSEVTVTEGGLETLKLVAPARTRLTGRVTEGGQPLASAMVKLFDQADADAGMPFFETQTQDKTNTKGEFTIEGVKVGSYTAQISHPSRAMIHSVKVEIREDDNELTVELPVTAIEGRVTGADAKPLKGVRVRAERAESEGPRGRVMTSMVFVTDDGDDPEMSFASGDHSGQTVTTDADGRYTLRGVHADVDLIVKASGKDLQPKQTEPVKVAADQTKSGVDLQLEAGGTIEVDIVRGDGRPGTSCMVRGRFEGDPGLEPKAEFTGAGGKARLAGLKPGKWRLSVTPMGNPSNAAAEIPDQVIEVAVGKPASAHFEIP